LLNSGGCSIIAEREGGDMLKRYQVLLSDWQGDYLKDVAKRYNQSFSEIIRVVLSEGFLFIIPLLQPEYKAGITHQELLKMTKKAASPETTAAEKDSLAAKLYFEARKAVEYRLKAVKKAKKKPG